LSLFRDLLILNLCLVLIILNILWNILNLNLCHSLFRWKLCIDFHILDFFLIYDLLFLSYLLISRLVYLLSFIYFLIFFSDILDSIFFSLAFLHLNIVCYNMPILSSKLLAFHTDKLSHIFHIFLSESFVGVELLTHIDQKQVIDLLAEYRL